MSGNDDSQSDTAEVARKIRVALLCDRSYMASAVGALVKALRFDFTLEVGGRGNPGYDEFIRVANKLDVRILEFQYPMVLAGNALNWASDRSTKNLRAWIPDIPHRLGDLTIWLPFLFEHHVRRLRENVPDFQMPKVDSLYLLLIWSECFEGKKPLIAPRILQDLLASEPIGKITAGLNTSPGASDLRDVGRKAAALKTYAQMYLGFCSGPDGLRLCREAGLDKHPYNAAMMMIANAMSSTSSGQRIDSPWLVRHDFWDADKTDVILRNSMILYLNPKTVARNSEDYGQMLACLEHRLEGLSEAEIADRLGFAGVSEYEQWHVSHSLDIDNSCHRFSYDGWIGACTEFGLDPNDNLVDLLTAGSRLASTIDRRNEPSASEAEMVPPEPAEPPEVFKFSPDYRSVSIQGEQHFLSQQEAAIIRVLHEAYDNGTPDVGVSLLIEAATGEFTNAKKLRDIFKTKTARDALISSGKRRGTYRLKLPD